MCFTTVPCTKRHAFLSRRRWGRCCFRPVSHQEGPGMGNPVGKAHRSMRATQPWEVIMHHMFTQLLFPNLASRQDRKFTGGSQWPSCSPYTVYISHFKHTITQHCWPGTRRSIIKSNHFLENCTSETVIVLGCLYSATKMSSTAEGKSMGKKVGEKVKGVFQINGGLFCNVEAKV